MKRFGIVLLSVLLALGVMCGCSAKEETTSSSPQTTTSSGHHAEPGEPNHHK